MKKRILTVAFAFAAALWAGAAAPAQGQEKTGTSVSHQVAEYASFSIDNPTTRTIWYEVKWGNGEWKSVSVKAGWINEHKYKLNAKGEFFAPHIRFDRVLNRIDGEPWYRNYKLDTSHIVRGGFGPGGNTGTPKAYVFELSADRKQLDLKRK